VEFIDDAIPLAVLAVAAAATLRLALRGSLWAVAIPGMICLLGLLAFQNSEPAAPWGGDSDPGRLVAMLLLYVGIPWFFIALVITGVARRTGGDRR
jgi:hypothetical protein